MTARFVGLIAVCAASFLSLGCPIVFARTDTNQKSRIESVEDDLTQLTRYYIILLDDYNMHLYNYHKIQPTEDSRYHVSCLTLDILKKTNFYLTTGQKLKELESWATALFSCADEFQDTYISHIKAFHGGIPLKVVVTYPEPILPRQFEVRLQTLESNVIRFSEFFPKIEDKYKEHIQKFHSK